MIAIPADPNDPEDFDVTYEALEAALAVRDLRVMRAKLAISQTAFAEKYGLELRTLQEWEQGRSVPRGAVVQYLKVIVREPVRVAAIVADTLQAADESHATA